MKKSELVEAIAKQADLTKAAAERALDATIEAVTEALQKGDTVTLVGFGTFYISERKARPGFNPRTKKPIEIGAAKVPRFRAGKVLKDAIK